MHSSNIKMLTRIFSNKNTQILQLFTERNRKANWASDNYHEYQLINDDRNSHR